MTLGISHATSGVRTRGGGSGVGVRAAQERSVDFGASDRPLSRTARASRSAVRNIATDPTWSQSRHCRQLNLLADLSHPGAIANGIGSSRRSARRDAVGGWLARHCHLISGSFQGAVMLRGTQGNQLLAGYPAGQPMPPWIDGIASRAIAQREVVVLSR